MNKVNQDFTMKQENDFVLKNDFKINYPIPVQVGHRLVELGQDKAEIFKVLVDERVKIEDVFNVMFQFFESSLVHNISSIYHFDDNTPIENLMAILEITSMLKLFKVEEDLLQNTLEARISDQNCLYLLDRFYQVLNSFRYEHSSEEWFLMFSKILDYGAFNLKHLIKDSKDILREINNSIPYLMKIIVEKGFMFHISDLMFNNSSIIEFIISENHYDSVYDFLEAEKLNAIECENDFFSK